MAYIIVGLGNPGEEYNGTRHNTGRIMLEAFRKMYDLPDWKVNGTLRALESKGSLGKETVRLLEPETFMNKSGDSLITLITSPKKAEKLVVVHDDLDLPLGRFKISFNKSSGGHRGVESIIKKIKTEEFIRVRVGISKAGAKGKVKKPQGEEEVGEYILDVFPKKEMEELKSVSKAVAKALSMICEEGYEKAMGEFNQQK
jgi:PTH1 family peptidyl-tRNA hydrolase